MSLFRSPYPKQRSILTYDQKLPPEVLRAASVFSLRAHRLVEGILGGAHHSSFEGASIEFSSYKDYSPGDDVRYIDWKIFGRTDRIYLKRHMRETSTNCYLVLDCTRSMSYCGHKAVHSKLHYSCLLAAAVAIMLLRQGDAAGLLFFDRSGNSILPPDRRPDHLQVILQKLSVLETEGEREVETTDSAICRALELLTSTVKNRSMIYIFSDLLDPDPHALSAVRLLGVKGHDVTVVRVADPDEAGFDFNGASRFAGLEGEEEILAEPSLVRSAYLREFSELSRNWSTACAESRSEFVEINTEEALEITLSRLLEDRRKTE